MRKLLCLLGLLVAPFVMADEVYRYTVVVGGNQNGMLQMEKDGESGWRGTYEFNDRGRGPKISSEIQLDSSGIPVKIDVSGNNYLKVPVKETFELKGNVATWKNPSEQGSKGISGKAFYISIDGVPAEMGFLASALLSAPEQRLSLLPDGEAFITKSTDLSLSHKGQTTQIGLYMINGLDLSPIPIWLDADKNYFASGSDFLFVIREGYENAQQQLIKAQTDATTAWLSKLATSLAQKPENHLVIRNALLFDSETATTKAGQSIVIKGNSIVDVGADSTVKIPEGAKIIDAGGKMAMPGLWDMHVHIGPQDGLLHMAAGVTSVRDLANNPDELLETRKKFDSGELIGPRIPVIAGFIDGPGPYAGPTRTLVDNEAQANEAVDKYATMGFQQIKLYSSLKPELVKPIVARARQHGMKVSGHIPAFMTAEQAVRDGYSEIQHVNMIFLNFIFDKVQDTRTPQRFIGVAENAAGMDLKSDRVQSFIRLLQENKIVVDPTVAIFEGMFIGRPGTMAPGFAKIAGRLPPQIRRGLLNTGLPVEQSKDQLYRDSYRKMLEMIGELYNRNITLVAGTDGIPGFTLHRELELYVDAGIPAPKALQIATLGAAKVAGKDNQLGSIAKGKLADLILVNGNPASAISDIRKVELVIKDGVVYQAGDIYKSIGVR